MTRVAACDLIIKYFLFHFNISSKAWVITHGDIFSLVNQYSIKKLKQYIIQIFGVLPVVSKTSNAITN